jgi:phenylpyruvate tautomerase PptA (4-oxalocrotonate tautomerase family)
MPIMQVYYPATTLDAGGKAALARRLTDVLMAMEGGANTKGGRAFCWVLFMPIKSDDWWIGGCVDDSFVQPPGRFLVHVTVPEGYMSAIHKSAVHASVNEAIVGAVGTRDDSGASVLVVIDEVTEGNWGAGGHTISLATIADNVGLSKDCARFAWVRDYFDAKARQFASAGFPADTGGLLNRD